MIRSDPKTRFWDKVDKSSGHGPAGDCWFWTGNTKTGGYGKIRDGSRSLKAHRLSYEMHFGPIPAGPGYHGYCVCHRCDEPRCVNPSHLFLGLNRDNQVDKAVKGRSADCRGEKNPLAKLSEEDVRAIRNDGRTQQATADSYGISNSQVSRIKNFRAWAHA